VFVGAGIGGGRLVYPLIGVWDGGIALLQLVVVDRLFPVGKWWEQDQKTWSRLLARAGDRSHSFVLILWVALMLMQ
jgi:hypothetical protein